MTTGTVDYPEILDEGTIIGALERIATALEQLVLQNLPSPSNPAPAQREPAPWDNVPMPVTPPLQTNQPYPPMVTQVSQHPAPVAQPFPPIAQWTCPVHHGNKIVPAGVSSRTGRRYDAFVACSEPGCDEKPPRARR
jgi:hypothetical protein